MSDMTSTTPLTQASDTHSIHISQSEEVLKTKTRCILSKKTQMLLIVMCVFCITLFVSLVAYLDHDTITKQEQKEEASLIMQQLMQYNISYDNFTPQQQSKYFKAFHVFDENNDNHLNETEFMHCFQFILNHNKVFDQIDANADGILSYGECVAYLHEIHKIEQVRTDLITKLSRPIIMEYGFEIENDDALFLEYAALFLYFEEFDIHLNGYILKNDYLSISAQNQFISVDEDHDDQISATELSNILYGSTLHHMNSSWMHKLNHIFGNDLENIMIALHNIEITPKMVKNRTQHLKLSPFKMNSNDLTLDENEHNHATNANKQHICYPNNYCYYTYLGADTRHVYDPPFEHEHIEGIFIHDSNHYLDELTEEERQRIDEAQSICKSMQCCYGTFVCTTYQYLQCISSQNECIWDCALPQNNTTKSKIRYKKIFKGIDRHDANFIHHPQTTKDKEEIAIDRTDADYLSTNVMDSCGTIYQHKLTQISHNNIIHEHKPHHDEIASHDADRHRRLHAIAPSGEMRQELRRKLGVLGADSRWSITWFQAPYYKNVLLTFSTNEGDTYRCSGALISPRHILTAGHCVSDGAGNFYWNWKAYPSWNAGNSGTVFSYSNVWLFTKWHTDRDWNWDIAVITLDTSDTGYGWFSFGYKDDITVSDWFGVNGYPTDKGYNLQHQWMKFDYDITEHLLRTRTGDIVGGNSGGPAWLYENNIVYGVVSHETYSSFVPRVYYHNALVRITQEKYEAICAYLSGFEETEDHCSNL